jgi:hypothetical protein
MGECALNTASLKTGVKLGILAVSLAPWLIIAAEKPRGQPKPSDFPVPLYHEEPVFLDDIGIAPNETLQTYSGECTGIESCGDYFDVFLSAGERLFLSLCPPDGTADFDTGIGIWDASNIAGGVIASADAYSCGGQSEITFVATSNDTYRVLIGTFLLELGGTYTLAYRKLGVSISTAGSVRVGGGLLVGSSAVIRGGLEVSGPYLRIPVVSGTPPLAHDDCPASPPDYSKEGRLRYDFVNNVIWVCAPDFGGWNSLTLTPPP